MNTYTHPARQALMVWGIFFVINIIINGTVQFALGADMYAWKGSVTDNILRFEGESYM